MLVEQFKGSMWAVEGLEQASPPPRPPTPVKPEHASLRTIDEAHSLPGSAVPEDIPPLVPPSQPSPLPSIPVLATSARSSSSSALASTGSLPTSHTTHGTASTGANWPATTLMAPGQGPPRSSDDWQRLQALRALGLDFSVPEPRFEAVTGLIRSLFDVAVASVSLVEETKVHFFSAAGDFASCAEREGSFCEWGMESPGVFVVEDASRDRRFRDHPAVAGEPHIRFYAGAPLLSPTSGHCYGLLCAIDYRVRSFDPSQYAMLAHFGGIVGHWPLHYLNEAGAAELGAVPGDVVSTHAGFWQLFASPPGEAGAAADGVADAAAGRKFELTGTPVVTRDASTPSSSGSSATGGHGWGGASQLEAAASAASIALLPLTSPFLADPSVFLYFGVFEIAPGIEAGSPESGEADAPAPLLASQTSFIAHRPKIMQEVILGPLLGVGSRGRTYRGLWHGSRVAVQVVEWWSRAGDAGGGDRGRASVDSTASGRSAAAPEDPVLAAALSRALAHPHLVGTYVYGTTSEEKEEEVGGAENGAARHPDRVYHQTWIVKCFCNRGNLKDAIERGMLLKPDDTPDLQGIVATACEVLYRGIAGALSYLHACGVLHGDLTGTAVLLTSVPQDQRRWVAKLSAFGLAELVARGQGRTRALARASVASVAHWAPEVLVGGVLSEEGDVYSLGVLLWEMCAGRSAWEGLTAPQILQTVGREGRTPALALLPETIPQDLKDVMGRCLFSQPAARPKVGAVLSTLTALAASVRPSSGLTGRCLTLPTRPTGTWADEVEEEEERLIQAGETLEAPTVGPPHSGPPQAARSPRAPAAAARPTPSGPPYKIYISNLPWEVDEYAIERFFQGLEIRDIILLRHRDTQKPKGCFVEFGSVQDLTEALTADGAELMRRPISAAPAAGLPGKQVVTEKVVVTKVQNKFAMLNVDDK
ncbi:putative LIM domain-containing serine/threonine-protein kinase [Auxenochlorella protothecoides]|uniref:Putative LIM domain-containing serine/threonine-protein kinase n=1 Tax=Auxenochlorella protothecoides TaxID=3075 RepID=A0A087SHP5_AUXPR|nr:putative LIM domain-containing serine/threonine-protein kinase [Auxenochlorella protothecoides]KFM25249.1 putative LIM domain-containing serine/threonine-protein kinase [Auxenochlorella protothecoides]